MKEGYDGRYGEVNSECLACHAGEAIMAGKAANLSVDDVNQGITCSVCHNVHGKLDKARVDCNDCHIKGAFYHKPEKNNNHVVCGKQAKVNCVNCHMPLTAKSGSDYNLHSHRPGIIPPEDSETYEMPSSCQNGGCHEDKSIEWLTAKFGVFYSE